MLELPAEALDSFPKKRESKFDAKKVKGGEMFDDVNLEIESFSPISWV